MKNKKEGTGVRPFHLTAAIVLLITGLIRWEQGGQPALFLVMGFLALLVSFSFKGFFSRPAGDALALWLEAVCFMLAAFVFFRINKILLPWMFVMLTAFYGWKGYQTSGLKK